MMMITMRPRCRVGQLWPKVEDDILQTIIMQGGLNKLAPLLYALTLTEY